MAPFDTEPAAQRPSVRLGDRFEILPGDPAAEFRSPDAEAFAAIDRDHPDEPCFALICEPGVPPRMAVLETLGGLRGDTLLKLLGWGIVDWPPRGRRVFALAFERPESRVAATLAQPIKPISEDEILANVLPPLIEALKALGAAGHTHRSVRPTNLFRRAGDPRVVLGECVSTPPGAAQPMVCEPVESGLAAPAGRGAGTQADDLYALGATLVLLLRGLDPTQGMSDETILAEKINRGSFAVLMNGAPPTPKLVEAIRGLLADDPRERWTVADLEAWLHNKHVAGRQLPPQKRAVRPFMLGETAHVTARTLARHLLRGGAAAAQPIRSGEIEDWVTHALADPDRANAFAAAIADAGKSDGAQRDARLVARVAMALDPAAPVRHHNFAAAIDGFGTAIAASFASGSGGPAISDAILARLPHFWLALQGSLRPEQVQAIKLFDRLRLILEDRRLAFGLPRLLYELNSGMHCLAPAIERDHVLDAAELLPALERAAPAGRIGDTVIDRHLAAFIAVRCKSLAGDWLDDIAAANASARALATLKVLAHLQGLAGRQNAPALGARIARAMPALIDRYHSRGRRARLTDTLNKLSGKGNFVEILALVAGPGEAQQDEGEFRAARREHAEIEQQLRLLRDEAARLPEQAAELGGQIAVAVAGALAAGIVGATLFLAG